MGFLRDPRTRETFASLDRSGMLGGVQQRAAADVERMNVRERDNRTAEWLATQPNGQKYADAIRTGALTGSEAYSQYISDTQQKGVKVGDKLVDPTTGKVIYEDTDAAGQLSKEQLDRLNQINDDLIKRTKLFEDVRDGIQRINIFYNSPSGTSDYALAVSFAKILDPGSVAREGEVRAVQNAGAKVGAYRQSLINAITGEGSLTPTVRYEIANLAAQSYKPKRDQALQAIEEAKELARAAGIEDRFVTKIVVPDVPVVQSPPDDIEGEQPNGPITQSALDAGLTQDVWNQMTPDEIAMYP
jgi:hypothetical protein